MASDLISRAAAIEYLMTNMGWHDDDGYEVDDADEKRKIITDLVNGIPAADAAPVVHGHWIDHKDEHQCSVCKEFTVVDAYVWIQLRYDFCPYCGAKMDGDEGEC